MKRFLLALALVALAMPAYAQTPAPTVAATAAPDAGQTPGVQTKRLGGAIVERAETFAAGLQVGATSTGAALLTFVKRGTCTVNPNTLSDGAAQGITCTATGAAAGDAVVASIATIADGAAVTITRAVAATDSVTFNVQAFGAAANAGNIVIDYVVIR